MKAPGCSLPAAASGPESSVCNIFTSSTMEQPSANSDSRLLRWHPGQFNSIPAQALTQIGEHLSLSRVRSGMVDLRHLRLRVTVGNPKQRRAGGERAQLANCHTRTSIHSHSASTLLLLFSYYASTLLLLLLLLHSYSALFSVQLNCWWLVWCTSMPLPLVSSWCTGTGAWCTGASYWYLVHWRLVH